MRMVTIVFCGILGASSFTSGASADQVNHGVKIVSPLNGATVQSPVDFKMEVVGKTVHPAGVLLPDTGHHHLIADKGCIEAGTIIGMGDGITHFGKGQTETQLNLPKGKHSISLQFADGSHVSYGKEWCHTIEVEVE